MKKINWLIEEFNSNEELHVLRDSIIEQGHNAIFMNYYKSNILGKLNQDDVIIFVRSFQTAKELMNR